MAKEIIATGNFQTRSAIVFVYKRKNNLKIYCI